jgi:hypothetical protein
MSEAALLHALISHSLQQAREAAEEAAYTAFAEWSRTDPEEAAIEAAERARRIRNRSRGSA